MRRGGPSRGETRRAEEGELSPDSVLPGKELGLGLDLRVAYRAPGGGIQCSSLYRPYPGDVFSGYERRGLGPLRTVPYGIEVVTGGCDRSPWGSGRDVCGGMWALGGGRRRGMYRVFVARSILVGKDANAGILFRENFKRVNGRRNIRRRSVEDGG